jgi:cyclopropane fatty-acyl-phospholipid synthase-like methyltransferase
MTVFHDVRGVPTNSCMLMDDPQSASAIPRGDLRLGFCGSCGFIANTAFQPELTVYGGGYEETQGFSPRFRAFAEQLARRWVDRHGLRGKRILEIGCGKGEFLASLAELGGNSCIGVDPAVDLARAPVPRRGSLQLLPERYEVHHADPPVDAVVCRHTLEHIGPVRDFLLHVRAGTQPTTVLLFELPDTTRILRQGALEDVYYEHSSYFTEGSLSRLFRRCGFTVLDVELAYEDQYLLLEAVPGPTDVTMTEADHRDVARTAEAVRDFQRVFAATERHWRERLRESRARGGRTVLWGGGSKAVGFLSTLGVSDDVAAVVDINPHKQGKAMPGTGHPVVSPESLVESPPDLVIVMNPVYVPEITSTLHSLGLDPVLEALGR